MLSHLLSKYSPQLVVFNNERGFVLVSSLLLMVLLLMLGLASSTSTVHEMLVSANDREYKRNFYRAEGAGLETGQLLQNEQDTDELRPDLTSKVWLQPPTVDFTKPANWTMSGATPTNFSLSSLNCSDSTVRMASVALGVAKGNKGGSLDMTSSSVKTFQLFGYSIERGGRVIIELGYKKRF